jgi:hypothetical protein
LAEEDVGGGGGEGVAVCGDCWGGVFGEFGGVVTGGVSAGGWSGDQAGKAEVDQDGGRAVGGDHDVGGFDVAVGYGCLGEPAGVDVVEGCGGVQEQSESGG